MGVRDGVDPANAADTRVLEGGEQVCQRRRRPVGVVVAEGYNPADCMADSMRHLTPLGGAWVRENGHGYSVGVDAGSSDKGTHPGQLARNGDDDNLLRRVGGPCAQGKAKGIGRVHSWHHQADVAGRDVAGIGGYGYRGARFAAPPCEDIVVKFKSSKKECQHICHQVPPMESFSQCNGNGEFAGVKLDQKEPKHIWQAQPVKDVKEPHNYSYESSLVSATGGTAINNYATEISAERSPALNRGPART